LRPVFSSLHFPLERTEIDKAAATRFIKHAIAQAQWKKTAAEESQDANDDDSDGQNKRAPSPRIPVKVTQKMRQREAYEKEMKERDAMESSDDELEVFDGENKDIVDNTRMDVDIDRNLKGKGKEVAPTTEGLPSSKNKRRRPPIDPFAGKFAMLPQTIRILINETGYGDDIEAPSTSAGFKKVRSSSPPLLPSTQNAEQKSSSHTPTIFRQNTPLENSKANKKKKKAKKTS
jgi:exosome complex protein LRP1